MKALISPDESNIQYVSSWKTEEKPPKSVISIYENSCRVAEVQEDVNIYPVGGNLFWITCQPEIVADQFYFDTKFREIKPVANIKLGAVNPAQPTSTGTQAL
jgi:hypothetical protein